MDPKQLHVIQALEKAGATEHLTDREKHLIGLAVTITRGSCSPTIDASLGVGILAA